MTQQNPRYAHDCAICTYLGQHLDSDLYFCPQGGIATLIARHSSEPSDYISAPISSRQAAYPPVLNAAYDLAFKQGVIS